jgi:phosphoglycolate phosphatase
VSDHLVGIDLVIFDKDGTLIALDAMWGGWARDIATRLERATDIPIEADLFTMLGYEPATGRILPHGGLAATPMTGLRERTRALLVSAGLSVERADEALAQAWRAPDPVGQAHPLTDLAALFDGLRSRGRKIALATTDDRDPTVRTIEALGLAELVDAIVCADDGVAVKPAPDMVDHLCARLETSPSRTAVVGDSVADLEMGRRAGARLVIGVLTGVGSADQLGPIADLVLQSVTDLAFD